MPTPRIVLIAGAFVLVLCQAGAQEPPGRNTLVPAGHARYQPSVFPDRIVLVANEAPWHSQTVNWRTNHAVKDAEAQITEATDTPGLHRFARTVQGETRALTAENGAAHHHSVTFRNLRPDTLYAYRVRGGGTWSEWLQFRTAREHFAPFSFLYFGDAQNSVKSHLARVVREAWSRFPQAALMLHAGDLVNQREGVHDDEWGEWFDAGGFLHAMAPSIPVTGNHEYSSDDDYEGGTVGRALLPGFPAHFRVPGNGPEELRESVYYVEYQDVLFVALDSTQALQNEQLAAVQARWLEEVLSRYTPTWTIVSHHHPMFSVSIGRDNALLRKHWKPVYDRHGVDLVLQGHDHTYGRGANVPDGANVVDGEAGTVYVVSVAGPKMYLIAESAKDDFVRLGEDAQLYQIVHVEAERLRFEARTVTGALYDRFDIERMESGGNRLVERMPSGAAERRCENPSPPRPTRCWNGTELVH